MDILQKLMNDSGDTNDTNDNNDNDDDDDDDDNDNNNNDNENPDEEYTKMFQNSKIGNLAKEIANDIDMSAFDMNDSFDISGNNEMETPNISSIMQKLTKGNGLKNLSASPSSTARRMKGR